MKKILPLLMLLMFCVSCAEQIEQGHRGIMKVRGKVVDKPLSPGFYWYYPFLGERIVELNVQEKSYVWKMEAFSDDTQALQLVTSVIAKPAEGKIGDIYSEYGEDYFAQIAKNEIIGGIKDIIGKYKADQFSSVRGKIRAEISVYLKEKLASRNIEITGFDFVDTDFDEEYKNAIQRKVVALQNAEAAKNETETIKEEAKQTGIKATAKAAAMKIMGDALASNPKLVQYEWVKKWNGVQPIYMMGGSATPLINIPGQQ